MTTRDFNLWTQADAIAFIRLCERSAPDFGFHVALTGGNLWGNGESKDCDIVLYRELYHKNDFNPFDFFRYMQQHGLKITASGSPWSVQAEWCGKAVDFFIPEFTDIDPLTLPQLSPPARMSAKKHSS